MLCKIPEGGPTQTGPTKLHLGSRICLCSFRFWTSVDSLSVKTYHGMVETPRISSKKQVFQRMTLRECALPHLFTMKGTSSWTPHPEATTQMQVLAHNVTWENLKCLSNQVGILLKQNYIADTLKSHLMVLISVRSKNSICITQILLLALICPGQTQHSYWAHLLNPPLFDSLTL